MERKERNVIEWQKEFENGLFDDPSFKTQVEAGWYDWFCKDTSLANKTKKMGKIIAQVKAGGKVDVNNWYVWFKNNCPCCHPLYDDFRFAEQATGDTQLTIQINAGYNKHRYTVYGRRNNFETPLFESDSSNELVKWLNTAW